MTRYELGTREFILEQLPFLGRGLVKRGKKKASQDAAPPNLNQSSPNQSKRSDPRICATCGKPQKGHARVNRRLVPCRFSQEELENIGDWESELERESALDKSHGAQLLSLLKVSLEQSDSEESNDEGSDSELNDASN